MLWILGIALALSLIACHRAPEPTPPPSPPPTKVIERTVVVTRIITRVVTPEAVTPDRQTPRRDLTLCLRDRPTTLDPLFLVGEDAQALRGLMGGWLAVQDPQGRWWSDVFERVPTLENGDARLVGEEGPDGHLEITYHIRDNIRWEDGTPITAEDFQRAWQFARNGRGAPSIQARSLAVADVRVNDARSFTVVLRDGAMIPLYPTYVFGPYPSHLLDAEESPEALNGHWPSYGPFRLVQWTDEGMLFGPNPHYSGPRPVVEQVRVRFFSSPLSAVTALIAGECDILSPTLLDASDRPLLDAAQQQGIIAYTHVPGPSWVHLDFNTWPTDSRPPFFADPRVRQAVLLALDRQRLRQEATHGLGSPLASWILPTSWAYRFQPSLREGNMNLTQANQWLDQAGWRDEDGDGIREAHGATGTFWDGTPWEITEGRPFSVTLLTVQGDTVLEHAAASVRDQLARVGIRVHVQTLPAQDLFAPRSPLWRREFDLALFAWRTDLDPDGRYLWLGNTICRRGDGSLYAAEANKSCDAGDETVHAASIPTAENDWHGGNVSGWAHTDASLAVYQATAFLSREVRAHFYAEHQSYFARDLPVLPLFQRPRLLAWRRGWDGLDLGPRSPWTWNIATWHYVAVQSK